MPTSGFTFQRRRDELAPFWWVPSPVTDIHTPSNKSSSEGLHSSGFGSPCVHGLTGWLRASLVLLHPTQSRNHKELPLELFKEFLLKMTGLCSCMYGFLWLEEVLVACVTNALKDNLASLPTLRGSPSIMVWSIWLPPQLHAEHGDHPEF